VALTLSITPKELERQAALAFEGKAYTVFLCSDPTASLGSSSTVAQWEGLELAEVNGYAPVTGTIGTGSYNGSAYALPAINAQFSGSGAGFTHDTVVIAIAGGTYPHSFARLTTPLLLQAGQVKSYVIRLLQDD
jgi:hypothetical protein